MEQALRLKRIEENVEKLIEAQNRLLEFLLGDDEDTEDPAVLLFGPEAEAAKK